jgi:NADPH:quinone reductase-like Zn-dependent oxidoreductase
MKLNLMPKSYRFGILGGVKFPPVGTFTEYIVVDRDQVIRTPDHLTDIQAAAWPVGGVTAWRFAFLPDESTLNPSH